MLLAADTVEDQPRDILDVMGAATADLFAGRTVGQIESMWRQHNGVADGADQIREVLIRCTGVTILFLRHPFSSEIVTAVACRGDVNIGMLIAQARHSMHEFDLN